ncbi:flagellar filament capping protein FliD [Hathewaya limosa]|uniref:Flagellar hook-associated protein 2 n=1 Tax=Hathewaya limosa TaxID=1536 RepID=A0ABU0JQ99_HATLI|nr:flagellar filament capping protein FliD [Hathewaya limosa]MDQ0479234.1 flagellar hook-associated protein 2 [Hathewaya limosa]
MRVTGLATGMDVDKMVSDMMKPYKMKVDKVKQQRELIKWKQDAVRDIIKDVNKLKYTYLDGKGGEKNILSLKSGDILTTETQSGTAAEIKVVKGTAQEGKYTVNVIEKATTSKVILDMDKNYSITGSKSVDINIDSKKVTIDFTGKNVDEVVRNINSSIKNNKDLQGKLVARFSEIEGGLVFQTKETGVKTSLDVTGAGFTQKLKESGKDARFTVENPDGKVSKELTSSENKYEIDGLKITLLDAGKTSVNVKKDTEAVYKKFKEFVDDYNKLVDKIYTKTCEKKQFKYQPLTEEQKKEMKKEDIERWEEKAHQGVLRDDSDLRNMLNDLRKCFFGNDPKAGHYATVEGCNVNFDNKLGINLTNDYTKPGQIVLDEDKFKKNLEENPEEVIKLFTKKSDTLYTPPNKRDSAGKVDINNRKNRSDRFNSQGILERINDVFLDYTRTIRYGAKTKGSLIEKAGMKDEYGSFNEFNNIISKQMQEKDELIKRLNTRNDKRENELYIRFSKLEKMMNSYNAQSSWLAAQFGGGK